MPLDSKNIVLTPNNAHLGSCVIPPSRIDIQVDRDPSHTADIYVDDHRVGKDCLKISAYPDEEASYVLMFDNKGAIEEKKRNRASEPAFIVPVGKSC